MRHGSRSASVRGAKSRFHAAKTMTTAFHLQQAARHLRAGGIVAYPTEGVWGLGCDPRNRCALLRLLALKRRDPRKGLILVAADMAQLKPWLAPLTDEQRSRLASTWPGPVTWVVPHGDPVSRLVTGGRAGIAVRVSSHPVVVGLCRAVGGPVVSTSANPSGRRAPGRSLQVRRYFGSQLDYLLPGQLGGRGGPSTVRDLLSGRILRA